MTGNTKRSIFVQIPSYRDKECRRTVNDMFEKADDPARLSVGICWQINEKEDNDCFSIQFIYPDQVREVIYSHTESKGTGWARSITQGLYDNENFTLQIDAHMRFSHGWDTSLIEMFDQLVNMGVKHPVISHYPPGYTEGGKFENNIKRMSIFFKADRIPVFRRTPHIINVEHTDYPIRSACVAGGFAFLEGKSIEEIPHDPNMFFYEELPYTLRLWTHGYDFFIPNKILSYHLYKHTRDMKKINIIQGEHEIDRKKLSYLSNQRTLHLLGVEKATDENALLNLDCYSLGNERTLHQYELFTGIKFKACSRNALTRISCFTKEQSPPGKELETRAFISKISNESTTRLIYQKVREVIDLSMSKSVLFIGMEDLYLFDNNTNDELTLYNISGDEKSAQNARQWQRGNGKIISYAANPFADPLPRVDMIVCCNIFEGIVDQLAWQLLRNITESCKKLVIINTGSATKDSPGLTRLCQNPFYFPEPTFAISDRKNKVHGGLWNMKNIKIFALGLPEEQSKFRRNLIQLLDSQLVVLMDSLKHLDNVSYDLLKTIPHQESTGVKRILNKKEVKEALARNNNRGEAAKDILLSLRYGNYSSRLKEKYDFLEEKYKLLGLGLTCEYIAEKVSE